MASYISAGIAALALLISVFNTSKKDTHQVARMMAKLDSISEDVRDVKKDLIYTKNSIQDNHDRIIKLEMSLKAAWKQIDEMKGGK